MKTSIFKRSMALFLAFLLCFTTFIGSAVTPAFAAATQSEVCVISFPRDGDANYSANWGHPDLNFTGGWHDKSTRFLSVHAVGSFTGEICYCIEPGVNVLIGDKVSQKDESFWDNYWLPAGPWLKAGAIALLVSLATPVFNSLCDLLIEDSYGPRFWDYFSVADMLERRHAGDVSWVNPLIFQIMLVCSIALIAVGMAVEMRRRKQG